MKNLETTFMGIKLDNPIILGASNISSSLKQLQKAEDQGIGAIVYKSLFEEQVQLEALQLDERLNKYAGLSAEMTSIYPDIEFSEADYHLARLRKAKETLNVPIFASLNALSTESWVKYAKMIEETGVDGIEVNLYQTPTKFDLTADEIEKQQINTLKEIKKNISIPVSVKLSADYTNVLNFIKQVDDAGADALVLFNSFFQPDIDIQDEKHIKQFNLSQKGYCKQSLRYAGMLYGNVKADICSTRGVFDAEDVIKLILSGANTVQVVSSIYRNGTKRIGEIKQGIADWMEAKGYNSLDEFRGKLANVNLDKNQNALVYKRAQYIDLLLSSNTIFGDVK